MASEKEKELNQSFEIHSIKRVNLNGSYKDEIKYSFEGKKGKTYNNWKPQRTERQRKLLARKIVESRATIPYSKEEINHIETHKVTPRPLKKERRKGFYYSGCRAHIVVQFKNQTPFWFPSKGGTTSYTISNNIPESKMLKHLLDVNDSGAYDKFKYWLDESKKNKNIFIYGGYTYKRVFSATGSFNGDSEYVDYVQRIFRTERIRYNKHYL